MKLDYEEDGHPISQQFTIKKNHSDLEDTSLWLLYFLGKPEKHPSFPSFPQAWRKRLQDKDQRESDLKSYQRSLFAASNDSVSPPIVLIVDTRNKRCPTCSELTSPRWLTVAPNIAFCKLSTIFFILLS